MAKTNLMLIDDSQVQELKSGNPHILTTIFNLYHDRMIFHAQKKLLEPGDVDLCVSKTFAALWEYRKNIGSAAHINNFLYLALNRICKNANKAYKIRTAHLKKWHKEIDLKDLVVQQEHSAMWRTEIIYLLKKQLEKLPPSEKKVLELYYLEGKSKKDIALLLNKSLNNVKATKAQAIKKLKRNWLTLLLFAACLCIRIFRWSVAITLLAGSFFGPDQK